MKSAAYVLIIYHVKIGFSRIGWIGTMPHHSLQNYLAWSLMERWIAKDTSKYDMN